MSEITKKELEILQTLKENSLMARLNLEKSKLELKNAELVNKLSELEYRNAILELYVTYKLDEHASINCASGEIVKKDLDTRLPSPTQENHIPEQDIEHAVKQALETLGPDDFGGSDFDDVRLDYEGAPIRVSDWGGSTLPVSNPPGIEPFESFEPLPENCKSVPGYAGDPPDSGYPI